MNEYTNPSEMLNLLFDGELDSQMETQLYASLLENEDLRTELRELITIREAVHKDNEAFALPVVATKNVFSELGYQPINFVSQSQNLVSSPWYKKLWNPIVTAIIASILTALFFWNTDNNLNSARELANANINRKTIETSQINAIPKTIQSFVNEKVSKPIHRRKINFIAKVQTSSDNEIMEKEKVYKSSILASLDNKIENNNSFVENPIVNNLFSLKNIRSDKELSRLANVNKREFQLTDNYYSSFGKEHSLTLCLSGISAVSFPNVNIESQSTLLSNVSFGGFIPLSKNLNIGLEVGQETFGQIFYNIENNQAVKYKQNPKLLWAGMGINYTFDKNIIALANAKPFLHFTLASTYLGPYGKAISGIQFVSDNGLGFNFGLEGSVLVYQNENRLYSTTKLGFIYGMFMRF